MIEGKISIKPQATKKQDHIKKQEEPFDWELYMRIGRTGLNPNNSIKTKHSEVVYSHEKYAQDAYNMYTENLEDKNLIVPKKGDTYQGVIVSMDKNTAYIDINYREYAYIELKKEEKRYLNDIKQGSTVTVKVLNDKTESNVIIVSYSDAIKQVKENEIKESINQPIAFMAKVKELINGGFIVDIDGIECFMPGSQVTMNKIDNFEEYVGKNIIVMPVNYSNEKRTVVVSSRAYLTTLIPSAIEHIKNNPKEKIKGIVTGTTKFGVFCEFNECLTGLIHISDLDKDWVERHKSRNIKPNDSIEFFVKEVAADGKIILTQVPENNPWDDIEEKYKVQSIATGRVLSIKEYGAFIELEKGISGLLHFSEYEGMELKEDDLINVKITRIEKSSKKITFTVLK
jgi:small subunit ribosomal protein S1